MAQLTSTGRWSGAKRALLGLPTYLQSVVVVAFALSVVIGTSVTCAIAYQWAEHTWPSVPTQSYYEMHLRIQKLEGKQ